MVSKPSEIQVDYVWDWAQESEIRETPQVIHIYSQTLDTQTQAFLLNCPEAWKNISVCLIGLYQWRGIHVCLSYSLSWAFWWNTYQWTYKSFKGIKRNTCTVGFLQRGGEISKSLGQFGQRADFQVTLLTAKSAPIWDNIGEAQGWNGLLYNQHGFVWTKRVHGGCKANNHRWLGRAVFSTG